MIEATCNKQEEFLNALRESNSDIIVSQMDKLLMSINRRSGKADHLVNLAKLVSFFSVLTFVLFYVYQSSRSRNVLS